MDDETILVFISELEKDNTKVNSTDEAQRELGTILIEVKELIDQRKIRMKLNLESSRLKKEFSKVDNERKELMVDLEKSLIENEELETENETIKVKL